nr:hypothetical protein Iba_chr10aCG3050 [Ipomoea batatas]GMD42929.1 hypothetical protein Iba_chr10cCG0410 [Ipomoea batatas]
MAAYSHSFPILRSFGSSSCDLGKMSDINFLYLFTGCLDLALIAGQKKQRVPHTGKTCLETTPETVLLILYTSQQLVANLLVPTSKVYPFFHLSVTRSSKLIPEGKRSTVGEWAHILGPAYISMCLRADRSKRLVTHQNSLPKITVNFFNSGICQIFILIGKIKTIYIYVCVCKNINSDMG